MLMNTAMALAIQNSIVISIIIIIEGPMSGGGKDKIRETLPYALSNHFF